MGIGWWKRWRLCRRNKFGVVVIEEDDGASFFPRTKQGREIGREIRKANKFPRRFPRGFKVGNDQKWLVYDLFNNDPEHPQMMIRMVGNDGSRIIDT